MKRALIATTALVLAAVPAVAGWDEGVAAFKSRDFQGAFQQFQEYVQQNPNTFQGHYMLGQAALQIKRHDEALNHLRKAYDLNPNDLNTKLALGRAYTAVRRYGEVATLFGKVDGSALPASHKLAFFQMRAQARDKAGDEAGALKDFEMLTKLQPKESAVHYRYAVGVMKAGRLDTAIASLKTASSLDSSNTDIRTTLVKALLNKARNTNNDKAAKRRYYQQAASEAKTLTGASNTFDNLMLQLSAELGAGSYDAAASTGERAVAKNGNDWKASFYLGQAYTSAGKFQEAEAPLNKANSLARSQSDKNRIWKQLGYAFEKQKKYAQAIEAYQAGGDGGAAARVEENQQTQEFNAGVEEENARIEKLRIEAEALEKELEELEGGGGF